MEGSHRVKYQHVEYRKLVELGKHPLFRLYSAMVNYQIREEQMTHFTKILIKGQDKANK